MTSRRVYGADADVISACAARGVTIDARQLERWRQASCLPDRAVGWPGGERGSTTANPAGYVDQVLAVAAAVRGRVALRHVPIVLFAEQLPVTLRALRSAYLDLLENLRKIPAKVAGSGSTDPLDLADATAVYMASRLHGSILAPMTVRARRAARKSEVSGRDGSRHMVEDALSTALSALLVGERPTVEGIRNLLSLAGLADDQNLDMSARHFAEANIDRITAAVHAADWREWNRARQTAEAILLYMRRRKDAERLVLAVEQRLPGLALALPTDAFGRGCLIPQQLVVSEAEQEIVFKRAEAMDNLAAHLEAKLHTRQSNAESSEQPHPDGIVELTVWATGHLAEAELLFGP
jgi:hypothetical protein